MSLLEDDSVKHGTEALNNVGGHEDVNVLLKMAFRILLSHVFDGQLLGSHLILVLQCFVIVIGEIQHLLHGRFVRFALMRVILQSKSVDPTLLVEIEKHLLLQFVFAVID